MVCNCGQAEDNLSFDTMVAIIRSGHSRIPIYEGSTSNVIGLLLTKELILFGGGATRAARLMRAADPDDAVPIRSLLHLITSKPVPRVFPDVRLDVMLNNFQSGMPVSLSELRHAHPTGRTHLAIVHDVNNDGPGDPYYYNVGIVTLVAASLAKPG